MLSGIAIKAWKAASMATPNVNTFGNNTTLKRLLYNTF